jgi:hypothetical protein
MDDLSNLEILWDNLLSRQKSRIRTTYASLSMEERESVILHLKHMAADPGWHIEQQKSAQAALTVLEAYIE